MSFDNFMDKVTLVPNSLNITIVPGEPNANHDTAWVCFNLNFRYYDTKNTNTIKSLEVVERGAMTIPPEGSGFIQSVVNDYLPLIFKEVVVVAPITLERIPLFVTPTEEELGNFIKEITQQDKALRNGDYMKYVDPALIHEHGIGDISIFLVVVGQTKDIKDFWSEEKQAIISKPKGWKLQSAIFTPKELPDGSIELEPIPSETP